MHTTSLIHLLATWFINIHGKKLILKSRLLLQADLFLLLVYVLFFSSGTLSVLMVASGHSLGDILSSLPVKTPRNCIIMCMR